VADSDLEKQASADNLVHKFLISLYRGDNVEADPEYAGLISMLREGMSVEYENVDLAVYLKSEIYNFKVRLEKILGEG